MRQRDCICFAYLNVGEYPPVTCCGFPPLLSVTSLSTAVRHGIPSSLATCLTESRGYRSEPYAFYSKYFVTTRHHWKSSVNVWSLWWWFFNYMYFIWTMFTQIWVFLVVIARAYTNSCSERNIYKANGKIRILCDKKPYKPRKHNVLFCFLEN